MVQYGAGAEVSPTCPRHPGVTTYVRCQRCNRPVCHACQRPAAVGVQCVDCVAAQQKAARPIRTIAGGKARAGTPYVTYGIIGLCVALFVVQMAAPGVWSAMVFVPAIAEAQPWRFLTAAFLHASIPHILFNMYALYLVGPSLEKALGIWRYVSLYVLSAIGGSVSVLLFASPDAQSWVTQTVGASGAVFGLFAALALTLRRVGSSETQILVLIGINLAIGFILPGISWEAHVGGLLVGAILGGAYLFAPREKSTMISVLTTVAVALALLGLIAVGV